MHNLRLPFVLNASNSDLCRLSTICFQHKAKNQSVIESSEEIKNPTIILRRYEHHKCSSTISILGKLKNK